MKKVMLSMLVLLVVLWSSSFVFAKGKGKGGGGQNKQLREVQNKGKSQEIRETAKKVQKGKSKVEVEKQRARASKGEAKKEENQGGKQVVKGKTLEKGTAKGKSAENIGKGKGHQQQMKAFERQMLHEEAKYRKRQAQFKRIRNLATAKGNIIVLGRLKILEEKERNRYYNKRIRMRERMQQLVTGEGKELQKTVEKSDTKEKGKAKTETEKAKEKLESEAEKVKRTGRKDRKISLENL